MSLEPASYKVQFSVVGHELASKVELQVRFWVSIDSSHEVVKVLNGQAGEDGEEYSVVRQAISVHRNKYVLHTFER